MAASRGDRLMQFASLRFLRVSSLLIAVGVSLYGQTGAGIIQGTVKDATGAVVPGAEVRAIQLETAQQRATKTNEVGFYLFPSAATGDYEIVVEMAGMEPWKGHMTLMAGQSAEVNPSLKVGTISAEVTVKESVAPLVTTDNGMLGTTLESARV